MCRTGALVSIILQILSASIRTAGLLALSLSAVSETVNQHTSVSAVPSDPPPSPSSTSYTVPGEFITLQSLNSYRSLPSHGNLTVGTHFHVLDSEVDLIFTNFGGRLIFTTAFETVRLAINKISPNVEHHPDDAITDGFFQQRHEGLSLRVHQYVDKSITWSLLNQVLSCLREYFIIQPQRLRDMHFEIEVEDEGRVGYGSLWSTGLSEGSDVATRDVNETSQPQRMLSISKPALTKSNDLLLLPVPKESRIIFSYHFYGPEIPESLIEACFDLARQNIRTHVQRHPHDKLPGGFFQYSADGSDVFIEIHAYGNNQISWLLLDDLLREINADLIGERHLNACELEFEIPPLEGPYGHGSLMYDPPDILPANRSQFTASGVRKTSRRLRDANNASNSPLDTKTTVPNSISE